MMGDEMCIAFLDVVVDEAASVVEWASISFRPLDERFG